MIPQLVELACNWSVQGFGPWSAWDLFAGVGLFTRFLGFVYITAVEANPISVATLRSSFGKNRDRRLAVESTTLAFLQQAVVQRDRPHLIVIDPPRAGVGLEVCQLLLRIAPRQITYVSCDPTTLARDLAVLQTTYRIDALHLVDLFPQTFHIETVAILIRTTEKPSLRSTL